MSIVTYVNQNNLPAPVTSGSGLQTWQDVWGDWWVAVNGVNNGAWRKARDVLHAVIYRNAAYTMPTANAGMPYDTVWRDPLGWATGLGTVNAGFMVPISGWYRVQATCNGNVNAAGQYIQGFIYSGASQSFSINSSSALTSGGLAWRVWGVLYQNAGAGPIRGAVYQPAGLAAQVGLLNARLEISFVGTG